ncbi:MAG: porin [Opitutales bacterium]
MASTSVSAAASGAAALTPEATERGWPADWFSWLEDNPGRLYQNKENPWLQELSLMGRFQYQLAYVDGEGVDGRSFNETHDEYRRARLGVQGKFLKYFGFRYQVNLVDDNRNSAGGGDLDWGYHSIDEAYLSFDLKKAMDWDAWDRLRLSYGRHKHLLSQEAHTSSNNLLTVERSAISNKVYQSGRPTGLKLNAVMGDWSMLGFINSSTRDGADNKEFNGWQDSEFYSLHIANQVNDALMVGFDFTYNDADATSEDSVLSYRWATSLHAAYDAGSWGVIGDLIYGDNGGSDMTANRNRQGDFWGVVVMPYYWLVDGQLQLVGQYQYAAAKESEGIRVNSRYGRADGTGAAPLGDVNSGRGDQHNSLYAGLNYYLAGHKAKVQAGVEYQNMETPRGDFDTTTFLLAFRTSF